MFEDAAIKKDLQMHTTKVEVQHDLHISFGYITSCELELVRSYSDC